MIERVSKAMLDHANRNVGARFEDLIPGMARAAIEAMREPTEADIHACPLEPMPRDLKYWRAMIDQVLKG